MLTEDASFDKFGVIALLASHGNVCNVMKEVGIQQAYALMTNSSQENNMRSSFDQALLRCLRLLRESVYFFEYNFNFNFVVYGRYLY